MRNSENTKNLIISKASSIFNIKGYRGTSISDITKATGMTKGAIYGNFQNKDELAVAAFEASIDKILNQLRALISAQPTAPLKLKALVAYYSEYIENPPINGGCPIINTSVEADDDYPLLRLKVVNTITMIKDSVKKIITRGILENQINQQVNAELYATTFYATIEGAILMSRIEGSNRSFEIIRQGLEMQINAIAI